VREHLRTLYAAVEHGFEGATLPAFVRADLEGYIACGALNRGFAHLQCEDCERPLLVAFSCGSRGFCPSCLGRRMCQGTVNLLAYVLPAVPLRQWVLTLPFELRAALAYERNLMGAVARIFADSVMGWYRRRLAEGVPEARGGAVTVIQRCSSDMKLNPHLHVILVDGIYVPGLDGVPNFRALPRLATDEVGDVLQVARVRILRYLARRGVVRLLPEALEINDELAERDPVLAQLAAAAVSGLPPAGPELRCRPAVQLARTDSAGPTPMGALVVQQLGFNLHAASIAGAEDQPARERLLRYVLRPPLAKERLTLLPDNRVRLDLKRPFRDGTYALEMDVLSLLARLARDGTYALEMDVLSLLARLAASVPPPKLHLVRYSGVLAPASPWRPLVVPPLPEPATTETHPAPQAHSKPPAKPARTGARCRYWPWAELMRLTLGLPVDTCPNCGGRMKLRALVRDPESIERFLRHQGLWTEPLGLAEPRPPPYFRSITRLKPTAQTELFE
jgi:hypothetical protein